MRTIRIDLYRIEELPEQIRSNVINNYRNINMDINAWRERFMENASHHGISLGETTIFTLPPEEVAESIIMGFEEDMPIRKVAIWFDNLYSFMKKRPEDEDTKNLVTDFACKLSVAYKDMLESIMNEKREEMTSDEAVIATMNENDFEFTSNGSRYIVMSNEDWFNEFGNEALRTTILQI